MLLTFLVQTTFGSGFPDARHSKRIAAPLATSKRVDGFINSIFGGTIIEIKFTI